MPTIREVAKRARVSVGTVSNVLGGATPVSKHLTERVMRAVRTLDYIPNDIARSLKIRHTRSIGMVVSDLADPSTAQMVRGAEDAAWRANYMLVTFDSGGRLEREQQIFNVLRARRVDGVLLLASNAGDCAHLRRAKASGMPIVSLDSDLPGLGLDCVTVDNSICAHQAVRHVAGLGHRRIGLLNGALHVPRSRARDRDFRDALALEGVAYDPKIIRHAGFQAEDGYRSALDLFSRASIPSAIFTANAMIALGVLRALRELRLRCPRDLSLVSFADPVFADALRPPLTAVEQPSYEIGSKGIELLFQRIEQPRRRRMKIVLDAKLNIRESSGGWANTAGAYTPAVSKEAETATGSL